MNTITKIKLKNLSRISKNLTIISNFSSKKILNTSKNVTGNSKMSTYNGESAKKIDDYYDIVICGGGMIGNALAAALGNEKVFRNLKIALIESMPKSKNEFKPSIYHSNRVVALNDQTIQFLKDIRSFDFIENNRYGIVKQMYVWDAKSDASISFHDSSLALIIESDLVQESLTQRLKKFSNIEVYYESKINNFEYQEQFIEIILENNKLIRTKLLIGSDGANSLIREKVNLKVTKWDYDQIAIVATLRLSEKTNNSSAWQRFLPSGPIALLPLDDKFSSLVWSIKRDMVNELLDLDDEQFAHRVNQAFFDDTFKNDSAYKCKDLVETSLDFIREVLPQSRDCINDRNSVRRLLPPKIESSIKFSRGSYPLSFILSNEYISNRVALVGDAVHKIHPLAGQGANLGFGDVICLTKHLKEHLLNGGDVGSSLMLEKYERHRLIDAFPKAIGIDILSKLYTDRDYFIQRPLTGLRTIGISMINRINPIKDFLKKQATKH